MFHTTHPISFRYPTLVGKLASHPYRLQADPYICIPAPDQNKPYGRNAEQEPAGMAEGRGGEAVDEGRSLRETGKMRTIVECIEARKNAKDT
eukprot:766714-Hanusia_phi.AAC.1